MAKTERPVREAARYAGDALQQERVAMTGCTIVPQSRLAFAKVLARSFKQHHPHSAFVILLVDKRKGGRAFDGEIELLGLDEIGLDASQLRSWPMLYDTDQLVEKVKPALIPHLVRKGTAVAAFFHPQIAILSPLDDLAKLAFARNQNVIAIGAAGATLDSLPASLSNHKDRSSISLRPLEDPAWTVGYWNVENAAFRWSGDHYELKGKPVRIFDFAGYDPDKPHLLSAHQGIAPRVLLSEHPALEKICDEYRERVIAAGFHETKQASSDFDQLPRGLTIDPHMHRLYSDAFKSFEKGEAPEPPSPFAANGDGDFVSWLNQPLSSGEIPISRYMMAIYSVRPDVQEAFPDPLGADAGSFQNWIVIFGRKELQLPDSLLPARPFQSESNQSIEEPTPSVSIAGYLRGELGMGEAARLLVAAIETASIPFNTVSYRRTVSRQSHPFEDRQSDAPFTDINIICVNADQMPAFASAAGPDFLHGRYTIGMWAWEVEDFPEEFHGAFNYVDEVWVASEFIRASLAKVSPKPVFKFHLPVLKPEVDPAISRAQVGLPAGFVFLFSFDFLSVLERKNPVGLIQAFKRAFKPGEGPALVIKTINGDKRVLEMEKLKYAARRRPDIHLVDGYLSHHEKNALMAHCDCYASLHRSEGYGLTIAEAMALGKPVIATGYSGNLDFMTAENSYLCTFEKTGVGPGREPYPETSTWSEPNIAEAARLLRHVYEEPAEARRRGVRAAQDMRLSHSPEVAGAAIRKRLEIIRHRRTASQPSQSFALLQDRMEALEAENLCLKSKLREKKSASA